MTGRRFWLVSCGRSAAFLRCSSNRADAWTASCCTRPTARQACNHCTAAAAHCGPPSAIQFCRRHLHLCVAGCRHHLGGRGRLCWCAWAVHCLPCLYVAGLRIATVVSSLELRQRGLAAPSSRDVLPVQCCLVQSWPVSIPGVPVCIHPNRHCEFGSAPLLFVAPDSIYICVPAIICTHRHLRVWQPRRAGGDGATQGRGPHRCAAC